MGVAASMATASKVGVGPEVAKRGYASLSKLTKNPRLLNQIADRKFLDSKSQVTDELIGKANQDRKEQDVLKQQGLSSGPDPSKGDSSKNPKSDQKPQITWDGSSPKVKSSAELRKIAAELVKSELVHFIKVVFCSFFCFFLLFCFFFVCVCVFWFSWCVSWFLLCCFLFLYPCPTSISHTTKK